MHWADIYALMIKAGWPPSRVADHLGVQRSAVSQVIRNEARSHNIANFIAAVTKTPLNRMFPSGAYSHPPRQARHRRAAA